MTEKTEEGTKKKAPTLDEMLDALNDPAKLQAVLAAKGISRTPPKSQKKESAKKRERPAFKFDDTEGVDGLVKAISEGFNGLVEYVEGLVQDTEKNVKTKMTEKDKTELLNRVKDFKATHEHFDKVLPMLDYGLQKVILLRQI